MANEGLVMGKEYTLLKREATEGVDAAPEGDLPLTLNTTPVLLYAEGLTINKKRAPLRKTGHSPFRPGWKSKGGALSFPFSIDVVEIYAVAISAATSRPLNDAVWDLLGFGPPVYKTAPPETVVGGQALTRTLVSAGHGSCTMKHYWRDELGATRILWTLLGCRAGGTISGGSAEPLVINVRTGFGSDGSGIADSGVALPVLSYFDSELDCPLPLICESVTIAALQTVEGSPDAYTGEIKSFEIALGDSVSERRSIDKPGGLAKVQNTAANYVELTLVLQATDTTDWDAYRVLDSRIPIELTLRFDDSEDPNNRFYIHGFFQIEDIDEGTEEEIHTRTITAHGIFDESDGWTYDPADATADDPGCQAGNCLAVRWETIP